MTAAEGARAVARRLRAAGPMLVVLALAVLPILPALAAAGIVATRAGGDSPFLLQRAEQMAVALAAGHVPPRWMPDGAFGLGYPLWNYYAPLAWYAAGGLAALGGGVVGGLKVTLAACFLAAAGGAYVLARDAWRSEAAGVLGAAAYTFAPYHLINVYVRGDALSELAAYAVFPWLLVAIDRAVAAPAPRRVVALALATAALPLAHNISALLFAPLAAAHALRRLGRPRTAASPAPPSPRADGTSAARSAAQRLVAWWRGRERGTWPLARRATGPWAALAAGAGLGALLAAFFWLPALAERDAVQLDRNLQGYFDYRGHFRGLDLVDLGLWFRYDLIDDLPARVGLAQLATALVGAALAWTASARAPRRRREVAYWAAAAAAALAMATPVGRVVWEAVPLLAFAQFPWRWLSVAALPLAVLAGALAPAMGARRAGWSVPAAAVATALLAASAMGGLTVATLPVRDVDRSDLWTFELASGNVGTTVRHEYLPAGVAPPPAGGADATAGREAAPRAVSGVLEAAIEVEHAPARQEWRIEIGGGEPAQVAFPTYAFPGWTVAVDGGPPVAAEAVPGSGWLRAEVPPGGHDVVLSLERTLPRALGEGLSLAALLACAALWLLQRSAGGWWRAALAAAALAGLVVAARLLPVAPDRGPVTLDWSRAPWPHRNPDGVRFGAIRLASATLDAGGTTAEGEARGAVRVAAGDPVRLELVWDEADGTHDVAAALVSATELQGRAPDVLVEVRDGMTSPQALELRAPVETPPGLYLVRLRVLDERGETTQAAAVDGSALDAIYLGPVRVAAAQAPWATPPASPVLRAAELVLHAVAAEERDEGLLVTMVWQADRAPATDYKTSVRLRDEAGRTLAQVDEVPLYGSAPPTSWPAGVAIRDRRWLPLPDDLPAGTDYRIEVVLYTAHDDAELGKGTVGRIRLAGRAAP